MREEIKTIISMLESEDNNDVYLGAEYWDKCCEEEKIYILESLKEYDMHLKPKGWLPWKDYANRENFYPFKVKMCKFKVGTDNNDRKFNTSNITLFVKV